jgi:hypothetical protein
MVKDRLLLFVHGLGGAGQATWRDGTHPGFPELISADGALRDLADVAFFEYPTSLLRLPFTRILPRIRDLAEGLRSQIEIRYPDYKSIALICHSLGGLVARKYLIEEVKRGRDLRVDKLLLFAVPNNGWLGGGLSNMVQLYAGLAALVGNYTFYDGIDTPIVRAAHGDSSGVRGAAWLWSTASPT